MAGGDLFLDVKVEIISSFALVVIITGISADGLQPVNSNWSLL